MALYRGNVKLAGIGAGFNPSSSGSTGQYLKRTSGGYDWDSVSEFEPSNAGSTDQVLTKTAGGYEWATLAAGGLPVEFVETQTKTMGSSYGNYSFTLPKSYEYDTLMIAVHPMVTRTVFVTTANGLPENNGSYNNHSGIHWNLIRAGNTARVDYYQDTTAGDTLTVYVYRLNLPS